MFPIIVVGILKEVFTLLGVRIADLRKKMKLSQYELADRLGFSRGKLANYEQGTREPDYETLQKIADFFDVSIDYILGRSVTYDPLDELNLGPDEMLFFHDYKSLNNEDKQKIADHIKFLRHMAAEKEKDKK